jgi:acetoin utilization protein AcuB
MQNLSLQDAMTPFPYAVDANQSAETAHTLFTKHQVRHLAVVHEGDIIGVLSDRDVNLAMSMDGDGTGLTPVFALCTKPAYVVDVSEPFAKVVRSMADHRYGCTLVTEDGKLVGIVTTTDVCRLVADLLES